MIARADPPRRTRRLRHPPPSVDQVRVTFTPYPAASPGADQRLFGAFAAMCRLAGNAAGEACWQGIQRHARTCPPTP